MMDAGRHPNITLLSYSEVEQVSGYLGNFDITIRKKARYVDESKCTGCGVCRRKCPEGAISGEKKEPHVIDPELCIRCGVCHDVCRFDAVGVR